MSQNDVRFHGTTVPIKILKGCMLVQFSDNHPKEIEELWSTLCACWPNNLKVIIRYLIIVSGMAPNELLPYVSNN